MIEFVRDEIEAGRGRNINFKPFLEKYFKPGDDVGVAKKLLAANGFVIKSNRCIYPKRVYIMPGDDERAVIAMARKRNNWPAEHDVTVTRLKPGEDITTRKKNDEEWDRRECEYFEKEHQNKIFATYTWEPKWYCGRYYTIILE
ncbi:MAG: hypothetical protein LBQ66_14875, partial [Planctomycetaceae bacterium]|nr:hypothetical protein [Planctomycetaceae bacterium]